MSKYDEYDLAYHGGTYGGNTKLSKTGSGKKWEDDQTFLCAACGIKKVRKAYNSKQMKRKGKRNCLECLKNPPKPVEAPKAAPPPVAAPPSQFDIPTFGGIPGGPPGGLRMPVEDAVPDAWDASEEDDNADEGAPKIEKFNDQDDEDEVMSDWDASEPSEEEEAKPVHVKKLTKRQAEKAAAEAEAERKREMEENMKDEKWREREAIRMKEEQEADELNQIRDAFGDLATDDLSDYEGPVEPDFESYGADQDWLAGGDDSEKEKEEEEEIPDAWDADSEEEVVVKKVEKKEKKKKEKKKKKGKKAAAVEDELEFDFDQAVVEEETPPYEPEDPKVEEKLTKIEAPKEPEGPIEVEKPKPRKKGKKKKLGAHLKAKETTMMGEDLDEFDFF